VTQYASRNPASSGDTIRILQTDFPFPRRRAGFAAVEDVADSDNASYVCFGLGRCPAIMGHDPGAEFRIRETGYRRPSTHYHGSMLHVTDFRDVRSGA
jgi:hypothetical protein